jgi:hypothetical protein
LLHRIPDPFVVVREAVRVLRKANGLLFFRDLMRPESEQAIEQLVSAHAGQESEYHGRMLDQSLRAALNLQEIRDLVGQLGLDAEAVQATGDLHWTWTARLQGA